MSNWSIRRYARQSLASLVSDKAKTPGPRQARLGLHALEDRAVPASVQVSNTNNAGAGSFRQALLDVNASADVTNTVTFLPGLFGTIALTTDLPKVGKPVDIQGPGAALITLSGSGANQLFNIDDGTAAAIAVSISGLRIAGGKSAAGGGVFNQNETVTLREVVITGNTSTGQGGGIQAAGGSVTLVNSQVTSNTAVDGAGIRNAGATFVITGSQIESNTATSGVGTGGYYQSAGALQDMTNSSVGKNTGGLGAGLYITGGPATIVDSLIWNNNATNAATADGGGLDVAGGAVVLKNVTVSGNKANDEGGGVRFTAGSLEVRNSTIAFNASDADNSGASPGGGLFETAGNKAILFSTVVAKNTQRTDGAATQSDVSGVLDATSSFNLVGVDTGLTGVTNGTQGNLIGTAVTPRDALLQPLAFNGGITKTHAIAGTSAAKDAGDATGLGLTIDGRGDPFARVAGAKADIGAFEIQAGPVALVVTTAADENDATYNAASLSLREALRLAGTDAPTVTFAPALNGQTITLTRGRLVIDRSVSVQGPGAKQLLVNGNGQFQIAHIDDGDVTTTQTVSISGLTLTNGKSDPATGGDGFGGAVATFENVTLDGLAVTANQATSAGGGVVSAFGTLSVKNSTVFGNTATMFGGGVANAAGGTVSVIASTVSGNSAATTGGGLVNFGAGTLIVSDSTVSGNLAKWDGGGVLSTGGTLIVNNSTVAFNKADSDNAGGGNGGGISVAAGTAKMTGTIVAKNDVGTTGANPDINGKIDGTFSLVFNTTGWNQAGSSNNKLTVDPQLAALADNGGLTQTHLPATGSPAIDPGFTDAQINPDGLTTDQRGAARKVGASVDIGAVEFAPNTAPTISDIPNQPAVAIGTTIGPVSFTVNDAETPAASLTVAGVSSNTTLVLNANITFGGAGGSRTVTITPAVGQSGTATITVTVSDGTLTATDTFTVTVNPAGNTNPTISDIPNPYEGSGVKRKYSPNLALVVSTTAGAARGTKFSDGLLVAIIPRC